MSERSDLIMGMSMWYAEKSINKTYAYDARKYMDETSVALSQCSIRSKLLDKYIDGDIGPGTLNRSWSDSTFSLKPLNIKSRKLMDMEDHIRGVTEMLDNLMRIVVSENEDITVENISEVRASFRDLINEFRDESRVAPLYRNGRYSEERVKILGTETGRISHAQQVH